MRKFHFDYTQILFAYFFLSPPIVLQNSFCTFLWLTLPLLRTVLPSLHFSPSTTWFVYNKKLVFWPICNYDVFFLCSALYMSSLFFIYIYIFFRYDLRLHKSFRADIRSVIRKKIWSVNRIIMCILCVSVSVSVCTKNIIQSSATVFFFYLSLAIDFIICFYLDFLSINVKRKWNLWNNCIQCKCLDI